MIDWKTNKIEKIAGILEKMGAERTENCQNIIIKPFIMSVLQKSKQNNIIQTSDLNIILTKLYECDHHDLVRADNIITRIQNETDGEYWWGSVTQNLKWRK